LSQEQVQLLSYYQANYPLNKFITEEQVKTICHKYNLVCGDVSRFKGFVPEKNLREIESFKLQEKDISLSGVLWGRSEDRIKHFITMVEYNELLNKKAIRGDGAHHLIGDQRWCNASEIGMHNQKYFDNIEIESIQICAPVKDMDISGLELVEGYKLQKKHIPDPVMDLLVI